jgi:Xaa-Pro aminopeptidase
MKLPLQSNVRAMCMAGLALFLALSSNVSLAQQRREREPNEVYAVRRARIAAQTDSPVILWGFTGREEISQAYIFAQEDNFYYLTGHNEEGAGLITLPALKTGQVRDSWAGPREILFLPAKDPGKEKWNGVRLAPTDPDISARTGFAAVQPFAEMRAVVEKLARVYPDFATILPFEKELGGYPHEKAVVDWLQLAAPATKLKDIRGAIETLRMIKSPGEIAFLKKAINLSLDAHLEAMKMMRPGLWEYQISAKMAEVHAMGGSEAEGYAPIVGAGPNSTVLHYDKLARKIADGDIVVIDVGAQFSGYSSDITRTLPANGKFTPRQREIYEIVLGAQNAVFAALKPGMNYCKSGDKSLYKISYDYINSHGKDLHGKRLGQYYIHGLGHNIGLDVHDPGDSCKPLAPGMVVTVEPGIYIPDENIGVRIEDDLLITDTGFEFLSERLPRDPAEIEKIIGEAGKSQVGQELQPRAIAADREQISSLIAKYTQSIDAADVNLAAEVWQDSPDVSFIHPLGHEHGFAEIKKNVYQHFMGDTFSERKLTAHDISVHVYGDSAVAEFYWDFVAKFRKDGSPITTHGRETQLYHSKNGVWRLVHVHYSGMPPASQREGF